MEARSLLVGDVLLLRSGEFAAIHKVSSDQRIIDVYNVEVQDLNNYSVSGAGVLVHNKSMRASPLQTGGHTIKPATRKALGLSKTEAKRAIEGLKRFNDLGNADHYKIMPSGDYVDDAWKVIDNIFNYVH